MTEEVYSLKITLQVTDKIFRNPFLTPMDTPYSPIAKLGYIVELWDLPTLKRTIADKGVAECGKCTNTHLFFSRQLWYPPPPPSCLIRYFFRKYMFLLKVMIIFAGFWSRWVVYIHHGAAS
jgi:hypothetical protein